MAVIVPLNALMAQAAQRVTTAAIGVGTFDMRGTSTAPVFRLGIERGVLKQRAVVEVSVGYAAVSEDSAEGKTHVAFYEAQLQAQAPLHRFRPYLGVGAGGAYIFTNAEGRKRATGAVSATVGIRARLSEKNRLKLGGPMATLGFRSRVERLERRCSRIHARPELLTAFT